MTIRFLSDDEIIYLTYDVAIIFVNRGLAVEVMDHEIDNGCKAQAA